MLFEHKKVNLVLPVYHLLALYYVSLVPSLNDEVIPNFQFSFCSTIYPFLYTPLQIMLLVVYVCPFTFCLKSWTNHCISNLYLGEMWVYRRYTTGKISLDLSAHVISNNFKA